MTTATTNEQILHAYERLSREMGSTSVVGETMNAVAKETSVDYDRVWVRGAHRPD